MTGQVRLHLGCGSNIIPGWINIDLEAGDGIMQHDLTKPLPFASGTVQYVYSEHSIEHVSYGEAASLLREIRRVLMPGGVLRISTPDLVFLIHQYLTNNMKEWADVSWLPRTPCQMVNEGMRSWGHQFLYDERELALQLSGAGFQTVRKMAYRESAIPALANLECRPFHRELIFEAQ